MPAIANAPVVIDWLVQPCSSAIASACSLSSSASGSGCPVSGAAIARCARQPTSMNGRAIRRVRLSASSRCCRAVVGAAGPQLGDPEVHERERPVLGRTGSSFVSAAAPSAASSPRMASCSLGQVAAPAGELGLDDGQVHVEDAPPVCRRRRREAPSDAQMGGGLVEQAVEDGVDRERRREISVAQMGIGRERPEQRVQRLAAAGHRQREVVVGEQARGRRPVPGGLVVPDRLGDVSVLLVPGGRRAVQRRDRRRRRRAAARGAAGRRTGGGSGTRSGRRRAR